MTSPLQWITMLVRPERRDERCHVCGTTDVLRQRVEMTWADGDLTDQVLCAACQRGITRAGKLGLGR